MLDFLCGVLSVIVAGLTYKLWQYRCAIIQLQADVTLILNDLTRPTPAQSIHCNLCQSDLPLNDYAHHDCERLVRRAKALSDARRHAYDVSV